MIHSRPLNWQSAVNSDFLPLPNKTMAVKCLWLCATDQMIGALSPAWLHSRAADRVPTVKCVCVYIQVVPRIWIYRQLFI